VFFKGALARSTNERQRKGNTMKPVTRVLLAFALTSTIAATTAVGQPFANELWTVDENGPAILSPRSGGGLVGYSNGSYRQDPISGLTGWYYGLGGLIYVPGDVLLIEPQTSQPSDLLRFDAGGVFFFSEREPGEPYPDMADVFQLPAPINPVILLEVGPEGNNRAHYAPDLGMPGYADPAIFPGLQYDFISDVPEPSTFALTGLGAVALMIFRRRG
jgi:hypothetical protein